ncbi:ABC transporter atnG [Colletotrichum sp. SAR 10_86]|nr:ABC transporter atnG [Colletotrichum sp. SAR 10_65]KAI8175098.1 ABC transporter atnG [Colletotrichum sp. SAR 10_75]KAI8198406.1 ABC transporter atnG [Colletotrichum sp. SAR 10_76]KAI8217222.1 ABC transporter atnG [Colletotrichum sp. SAR 10_77]KAI8218976.1 ABC transporter atnG [Colletotrichum sp. SAR 10_86]KAJ4995741.1 ABC transporter atnG [Colletotrichum sp. SAR 10_66]
MDNSTSTMCSPAADDSFGPIIQDCRDGFDFTLTFEQCLFTILPASLLLLVAPLRLFQLGKLPRAVSGNVLRLCKIAAIGVLAVLQLILIALWATHRDEGLLRTVSIAASCVSFVASLVFGGLSYIEHSKSLKPSSILNTYILVSLVLDGAILRTIWLSHLSAAISAVFTASFALKTAIVILEAQGKTRYLVDPDGRSLSPEETSGIYSRGLFWWLTPLLMTGFRRLLKPLDLFTLDESMSAAVLSERFWLHWNESSPASHDTTNDSPRPHSYQLVWACIKTLKWQLLAVVPVRLCLLGFTICQPLVLNRFLDFLQDPSENVNHGYGLIGAYGLVYLGISITSSFYWHKAFRSLTMLRGVLVAAVYSKTTELRSASSDDSAAVTLMSTDVDAIIRAWREIHEFWANIIQFALATWILSNHIGYAAAGPIIVSVFALIVTFLFAPATQKYQVAWIEKVQKRIGITSAMMGHVKSIKMSGLTQKLSQTIADLRISEMKAATPFRVIAAITSAVAQIPLMISPVVAFAMYMAIISKSGETLDATKLFAALSLVILLASPLFFMFETVLDLSAALGCFHRIENYLCQPPRNDYRSFPSSPSIKSSHNGNGSSHGANIEVRVKDVSFRWKQESVPVVYGLNFSVGAGELAMVVGSVASGKTTFLKGLLGEVPYVDGLVSLSSSKISWCEQSPWLINETIRKNITCFSEFDESLYRQVLTACDLEKDLAIFPEGDRTLIGSKGLALSGGQKQRIALARAVYSRPRIALFDDVFSGLDNHTAKTVFRRLFNLKEGILRAWGTTVVLATQSALEAGSGDEVTSSEPPIDTSSNTTGNETAKTSAETEDKRRQLGDWSVYNYYFGSVGAILVAVMLLLQMSWAFFSTFPTVWLKFWTDHNVDNADSDSAYYLGVYAALQVSGVVCFAILICAPLALFTSTDIGSITTRFSQDIGLVDRNLPLALVVSLASFFTCIGKAFLIASTSWYIVISFPVLILVFYFIQRAYLRTSRQLRFLDLEEKAPVYTHFLETLSGLPTIRAHAATTPSIAHSHTLIDRSQRPFYILLLTQQWLTLVLDLTTTALALLVVGLAVRLRDTVSVGLTGVSLVQLISFTETLKMLIQFWTSLETSIGAVARIKNFADDTPAEIEDDLLKRQLLCSEGRQGVSATLLPGWPDKGCIELRDISASYASSANDYDEKSVPKALDGISISIRTGEKIGIVGRTGSGKSSLLLALLRLLPLSSGSIHIDGRSLDTLPLLELRSALIAITQDQFVLPGTVRQNIDPFAAASDESITSTLTRLGLWDAIQEKGGLDAEFAEEALSHGQRQLFFLARAVLRREVGKIVLLDEATSSVDSHTERMVKDLIREEFKEHTVIAIAHRLETVADFDRVVVLDKGHIVEVGEPQSLLLEKGGKFKELWDASRQNRVS